MGETVGIESSMRVGIKWEVLESSGGIFGLRCRQGVGAKDSTELLG